MKPKSWLFRRLNLGLRAEIIVNISLLMLVAILLIGFTISKMNERQILQERVRTGEGMIRDFMAAVDFMSKGSQILALSDSRLRKEIQDFIHLFSQSRGVDEFMVVDLNFQVVASRQAEMIGRQMTVEALRKAVESGQLRTDIERTRRLFSVEYRKLILYSPFWNRGQLIGGIQAVIPIGDVMIQLLKSQRIILLSIMLDALVLIVFGSFLLSRVLVKPLKDLVRLTEKVSRGDFNEKIEVNSTNEIGQLISSFNRMIDRLKEHEEELENHVKSLESANRQLKQAQEEVVRSEKLASIGRFAAGVAHEVGNPLGAILGYTSILEKEGIEREEAKDYLRRIQGEIERINRIVRELLDFSRPSKGELREVDVNRVLESTLSLLSYQKDFKNIHTQLELEPNLAPVLGDESQISQVFINLILNAIDAMPTGGILTLQTREIQIEEGFHDRLQIQRPYSPRRRDDPIESDYSHLRRGNPLSGLATTLSKGDRVIRVRISDTGTGIEKEDLEKIFDPFFTTKPPDRGTGLGLSICLRIVESMGGAMRVESKPGRGTNFEVYLPPASHDAKTRSPNPMAQEE